ncbi:MAG: phosphoribosylglycinamide formyltransferase [Candidatus Omnitrophota bacterium]
MRIAIFASGRGSNFSAIARAIKKGKIPVKLALLVCDKPQAAVIAKAKRAGVKVVLAKTEEEILRALTEHQIDLIALAGFMRILSPGLVQKYKNKIINIHPSLLPAFKGAKAIEDVFNYGVKVTGVTVHFVDELMDHGPIILQAAVKVEENDTPQALEAKIHKLEHKLYPEALRLFAAGRLEVAGRQVKVTNR